MFDSFVLGLFGPLVIGVSIFFLGYGLVYGSGLAAIVGIVGIVAGAYMRYLSRQTVRVR
jgi:hypothetical protein